MPVLLQYRLSDGAIPTTWESNTMALLEAQIVPNDATYGYLVDHSGQSMETLRTDYYVRGGVLTVKDLVTLSATPNPFPADGVTICNVTVAPFLECTVLVDGIPSLLTDGDRTLELTSNVPNTFVVTLAPMAAARAEPLTVEAT